MRTVDIRGTSVPVLGLGTWELEGEDCLRGVPMALELGYRHLDTAQIYGNEEEVGRGLAASGVPREEVFLTTKLWRSNVEPARVRSSAEESLRKLRTDYVDLLLIHWPVPDVPVGATLEAMLQLVDQGKVRHVGVSNFPPSLLREAAKEAPILTDQVEHHLYLDQPALHELAEELDLLITGYSPLARGALLRDEVVQEVAEAHGATPGQVALAALLQRPRVAVIPKATSREHLADNLAAVDLQLSEEERRRLAALDRGAAGRVIDPGFGPDWED
jgi:2,5-diketo-D-gluconate reductase B